MSRWRVIVAVLLLLLGGAVNYLLPRSESVPPRPQLQNLPAEFVGWSSLDIPIDPRLVEVSAVDSYLNRVYHSTEGREVGLYVGYYRSQRAGDSVHSPKNCLPGAGWQPVHYARQPLALHTGRADDVNLYIVENERQRIVVLYWYQSHGRVIASEYQAKFYTMWDALRLHRTDSALVRVAVPVTGANVAAAQRQAEAFATMLGPKLDEIIPR